ncbi:MAG: efflux RND transporter periplasmic adaptor subunit [Candidatus Sumerlaeia bacterium]|nr:efflux RND transporter periplasmic adaptor subunit [Candidatus Sumerlaeia bacterium]
MRTPCPVREGLLPFLLLCFPLLGTVSVAQPPDMPPAPVVTAIVEEGSIAQSIRLTGNVEPLYSTHVRTEQAGLVEYLPLDVGHYVTTGTVMMRLRQLPFELEVNRAKAELARRQAELDELTAGTRDEDILVSRARVQEKQAELQTARQDYDRYQRLYDDGSVSESELETRRVRFLIAEADVASAEAELARDEAGERPEIIAAARADVEAAIAELAMARDHLARTVLRAPFAGTITERNIGPGGYVNVGDDVFRLEYIDQVKIEISVPETYFSRIPLGASFEIGLEAFPQDRFEGIVYQRVYRADPRSRSFPVQVRVDNPGHRIAPGMLARVRLLSELEGEQSMLVSRDALVADRDGTTVVRVKLAEDGSATAEIVTVQTGRFFGEYVEVFGDLRPRDQIVIRGNERVQPGQRLRLNEFITNPQAAQILDPSGFFRENY